MSEVSNSMRTAEFVRLLGQNERQLRAYVLSMVAHWADADEIVQQTRIRVWEQFDDYDREKDFGAWARTIAYYLVLAHREKASRSRLVQSREFIDAVAGEFGQVCDLVESRKQAMQSCLKKIDAPGRQMLERYYGGGESLGEIARRIGASTAAVKQRMLRLRAALAHCIRRTLSLETNGLDNVGLGNSGLE